MSERDPKPDLITLSARDVAYLSAVERLTGNGWCQCPRGRRLDASGLSWGSWRGAEGAAKARAHVETEPGNTANGEANRVRLTTKGRAALRHGSAQGQHRSPAQVSTPPDVSSSPIALIQKEKDKESEATKGSGSPAHPMLADPALAVMESIARSMERFATAAETFAQGVTQRDRKPSNCPCGAPLVPVRKGDGSTFDGCSAYPCPFTKRKSGDEEPRRGWASGPAAPAKTRRELLKAGDQSIVNLREHVQRLADQKKARA